MTSLQRDGAQGFRKVLPGCKPAEGGEGGRLKEAEKGLSSCKFSSKCSKRRGLKGHCGHKETCQKDSQPRGRLDSAVLGERVGWVWSSTETHSRLKQLAGGQRLHSRGHSAGALW